MVTDCYCCIGTMVEGMAWNDESNMLVALTDSKIIVFYYPNAAYVDRQLLPKTIFEKEARYCLLLNVGLLVFKPCVQTGFMKNELYLLEVYHLVLRGVVVELNCSELMLVLYCLVATVEC